MTRPCDHEQWCPDGYDADCVCTCDLELRQVRWDEDNRASDARPLPKAQIRQTPTKIVKETYAWLRAHGFMSRLCPVR